MKQENIYFNKKFESNNWYKWLHNFLRETQESIKLQQGFQTILYYRKFELTFAF